MSVFAGKYEKLSWIPLHTGMCPGQLDTSFILYYLLISDSVGGGLHRYLMSLPPTEHRSAVQHKAKLGKLFVTYNILVQYFFIW